MSILPETHLYNIRNHYDTSTTDEYDLFFEAIRSHNGLTIVGGLEQVMDYISELRFTDRDISYLRPTRLFQ